MEFKLGDVVYSIEDEDLGYISKVKIVHVDEIYIEFWGNAIETAMKREDAKNVLFKTYDEAANYIRSLGKRPKRLSFM